MKVFLLTIFCLIFQSATAAPSSSKFGSGTGGKVNLSAGGMLSTHKMGDNSDFKIDGLVGSGEIQGYVSNFILGLHATGVAGDKKDVDTFGMVVIYLGWSFDAFDLHLGYGFASVTQKITTNPSAEFAFNESSPKGYMLGLRKYFGNRNQLLDIGLGINIFSMNGNQYSYKESVSGIEIKTDFEKATSSFGGTLNLIISFGDRSLFTGS